MGMQRAEFKHKVAKNNGPTGVDEMNPHKEVRSTSYCVICAS